MWLRAAVLGAVMGVVVIAGLHWPLENEALNGLALFLAFTACVYPGALLAQRASRRTAASEIGFGGATFICAWMGVAYHPLLIAIGYSGHGVWDWLHHTDHVATRTVRWFPPACATFDIVVAAYVVWLAA